MTYNMPRGFSAIFGSGTIPVSARAVAQAISQPTASGSPAILMLGTGTNITDITANGSNSSVTVSGTVGTIYLDSKNSPATLNGSGATVQAPFVDTADSSLSSKVQATQGSVVTGAPQLPDPLSYLPDPPSASNAGSGVTVNTTYASSGITGTVTLNPSTPTIYIVGGNGIDKATLVANNAMFYLSGSAGINLAGNSSVSINQTTQFSTGTYAGISIFQARDDSTTWAVKGNGVLNALGTLYAPAAQVISSGNGGNVGSQIIASSMTMNGNGDAIAYGSGNVGIARIRQLGLVE